ncbi:hypothetical protein BGZ91_006205, partial [Linnemannia elongata]
TLTMSDHPLDQLDPCTPGSDSANNAGSIRKRDKIREIWGFSKSKIKEIRPYAPTQSLNSRPQSQESTRPTSVVSQASNSPSGDSQAYSSGITMQDKPLPPPPPTEAQPLADIFLDNLPKTIIKSELPHLQQRIERIEQLVCCNALLLQDSLFHLKPVAVLEEAKGAGVLLQEPTPDKTEIDWLEMTRNDLMEGDRLRLHKIAEIVALGPVLRKEPYRKLLSTFIKEFGDARILDILGILRVHLESTHQQSTEYSYHLTLAVSRILDVMADHKVQDLDRVLEHEPLSAVLSGLQHTSDPYLMYQACYAFQALQYVPDNESALQAVLRHSTGVVNGLVKVTAVFKLDLASVLEGLGSLQESIGGAISVAGTVYNGVSSLMESGRGVLDSLKEGLGSGEKRPWYPAVRAAYAFAQAGKLKDLKVLIVEAPCRRDPLFQWGMCQLLGEIAADPAWDVSARRQSVSFLGHLCQHDRDWGQDENVKAWMITIITNLCASPDQAAVSETDQAAVSETAHSVLQDLALDQSALIKHPYPLRARLPLPSASPLLAKVQNIPY